MRACVRACVVVYECVGIPPSTGRTRGLHSRLLGNMIHGQPFKTFSTLLFDDIRIKEISQKRVSELTVFTFQTHFNGLVCGYSKGTGTGLLRG